MTFGLERATAMPMRPLSPAGNPLSALLQVTPASVDLKRPLPGPPPLNANPLRRRWYVAAKSTLASRGSIAISVAPVSESTNSVLVHVRPASVVLNAPRSIVGFQRLPTAATHATSGSVGCSRTRPMEPDSLSPTNAHVAPASVERYTPPPHDELCRLFCSPVPAQTIFESPAKIAISPNVLSGWPSKIGAHVVPLLVVFQMPPAAAPM